MTAQAQTVRHPGRSAAAALWTGVAAIGLFLPAHHFPAWWTAGDTPAHLVLFGVATALWLWALPRRAGVVVAVLTAVAVVSEVWQGATVPGRAAEWADLGANLLGIALGGALMRLRRR